MKSKCSAKVRPAQCDDIDLAIQGNQEAHAFIRAMRNEICVPDALADQITAMANSPARLCGFFRLIEKFIERVTP